MLTATLAITIDAVAYTLMRVNQDNYGSEYKFLDSVREIKMKIRHSTDIQAGLTVNRHNVFLEHTVFATPTVVEKYWSTTVTLRDRRGSGPADLLKTWQGFNTLFLTFDDTFVSGDN